jgi:hypothetical protein
VGRVVMKMIRKRKRRLKEKDKRLSEKPKNDEKKSTVRWKKREKKCVKRSGTRSVLQFERPCMALHFIFIYPLLLYNNFHN